MVAYDGKEVTYRCHPHFVKWATGCGYHGKVSPFDGKGKMPWKLEWIAKWRALGVTIEGAGKDHTTKGGARDVANACFESLFGGRPYEFFLAKGKKMSSSKGVGTWARDMADFLAPDVLRYLVLRTQPQVPVDFPLEPVDSRGEGKHLALSEELPSLFGQAARSTGWRFDGHLAEGIRAQSSY